MSKNNYVDNKELYLHMCTWKEQLKEDQNAPLPDEIAIGIMKIANNLSRRYNFSGYTQTWRDEMIGDAVEHCLKYIQNFNPEKYNNVHAYITRICFNAFVQRIKRERKETAVKYKFFAETAMEYEEEEGEHKVDYEFYQQMLERVRDYEQSKKSSVKDKQESPMEKFYG